MASIEQEDIITLKNLDGATVVRLKRVFTPREAKAFCIERGWSFRGLDENFGAGYDKGVHVFSHYIESGNTHIYSYKT